MNNRNLKIAAVPFMCMFALVATGASAMTVNDEAMMKKEATSTDSMMKKDDAKVSSTSDAMMKKDDAMMAGDSMMKKDVAMAAPQQDLSMGSRGEEVVTLQTFLVSQSLLTIPVGVAMGYFGPLTKAALMSYQATNELPSTGYYGPLTRAVMMKGMMKVGDSMMKKDDAMTSSTSDAMMKKESTSTEAMMKKDDAMMEKKTQ